jgi:tetratricopeptide (TPR) repeat protein
MRKQDLFYRIKRRVSLVAVPAMLLTMATMPSVYAQTPEDQLSYDLNRVNLYMQTEQIDKARALIEQLRATHPQNAQVLAAEAELDIHVGQTKEGIDLLNKAQALAPNNEDIKARKKELTQLQSSFIQGSREVRITQDTSMEQVWGVKGEAGTRNSSIRGGAVLESNKIRIRSLVLADGTTSSVDETKQRGEFYLTNHYGNGNQARVSLFGAENDVGVGAAYTLLDKHGQTTFAADYQRPEWDYFESVVEEGTRDDIKITREQHLLPQVSALLSAAVKRYGLDGDDDVATSQAYELDLTYSLPEYKVAQLFGPNTYFDINYNIDAEYPFDVQKRTDASGTEYEPFPLESREIHNLTASVSKEVAQVNFLGYGGYAYDRLGGDGPLFGGSVSYHPVQNLTVEAHASQSIRADLSSQTLDVVGMNLKLQF